VNVKNCAFAVKTFSLTLEHASGTAAGGSLHQRLSSLLMLLHGL